MMKPIVGASAAAKATTTATETATPAATAAPPRVALIDGQGQRGRAQRT
jgi:hypothetical protein